MDIYKLAHKIEKHYLCHGVTISLILIETIETNDQFIFKIKMKPGTKESLIFERSCDIQTALQLPLLQPFKDGLSICLAVSERPVMVNNLMKMLKSPTFRKSKMWIPVALGYDMRCKMIFADLGKMPHAIYAGATASGKSTGLQCLTLSLLYKHRVNRLNLVIFDVGANTMEPFSSVPHLSHPIVKDAESGIHVVQALIHEMEHRIGLDQTELRTLPAIVCIIDEYISFINNIGSKKESDKLATAISDLLRRGRHAKIHLVLATQDPTLKNMKIDLGTIRARMAFACAKYHNSITILGEGGAEKLPGKGAMLYKSPDYPKPLYLQGAYMPTNGIKQIVTQVNAAKHDFSNKFVIPELDGLQIQTQNNIVSSHEESIENYSQQELVDIIMWTLGCNNISVKQIQERFRMGNRANSIMKKLFQMNLVTDIFSNQPRAVLPQLVEELSDEIRELLLANGVSADEISKVMSRKSDARILFN